MFRPFIVLLVGCSGAPRTDPPRPALVEAKPARCLRRADGTRFAERLYFDARGNLIASKREDRTLAVTLHRDATGALIRYEIDHGEPARAIQGTFQYGSHGELVGAHLGSADGRFDVFAELRWQGTFSPAAGTSRPFAALGGAGGADETGFAHRMLSANLAVRHPANPMAPVRFTGRVAVTYPGQQGTDRYEYSDGRLLAYRDRDGGSERFTWGAVDEPTVTIACSRDPLGDGSEHCDTFTAEVVDGHIVRVRGGGLDLRYDELDRLTAGTYRGSGDSVTWSDCPVTDYGNSTAPAVQGSPRG